MKDFRLRNKTTPRRNRYLKMYRVPSFQDLEQLKYHNGFTVFLYTYMGGRELTEELYTQAIAMWNHMSQDLWIEWAYRAWVESRIAQRQFNGDFKSTGLVPAEDPVVERCNKDARIFKERTNAITQLHWYFSGSWIAFRFGKIPLGYSAIEHPAAKP